MSRNIEISEIVRYCAPTLAGLKTANMFSVRIKNKTAINDELRQLNSILTKKGLRIIPAQREEGYTLLYLYRPDRLKKDLKRPEAEKMLEKMGYDCRDTNRCLVQVIGHLKKDKCFPHEIGLFLGYPPEDVRGFIESPHCGFKCTGCWKVYGDEAAARKKFTVFDICTKIYEEQFSSGKSLTQLIV